MAMRSGASAWSPLRHQAFRAIWLAGLISNIGLWMQNVGAAWLMTSLTDAAIMVALIQTATGLPSFLLALPAGAFADLADRRRLLLAAQGWMMLSCLVLSVVTLGGGTTPWVLLALTFSVSMGAAFNMPALQATTSDVVPRPEVPRAVALSGISFNSARAVGPLLAGVVIAWAGSGAVFVCNVLSFGLVMWLLWRWKSPARGSTLHPERLVGGMAAGMKYVRHSPAMHRLVFRSTLFVSCSSGLWALLPLVAREHLGLDAPGYGLLLGSLGIGAVLGAGVMPWLRASLGLNRMVAWSTTAFAGVIAVLAYVPVVWAVCLALVLAGVAWILINATISAAVHTSVAHWVRARALAFHLLAFQGSMALGAVMWGALATFSGTSAALGISAACTVLGLVLVRGRPLALGADADVTLANDDVFRIDGPQPSLQDGPVFVRVRYRIADAHRDHFLAALRALGKSRLRGGARRWKWMIRQAELPVVVELYVIGSWEELARYSARRVVADQTLEAAVRALHVGSAVPEISVRLAGRRLAVA